MAESNFALRLGYAGWLLHLKRGEAPGFAEIGRAVTRTGQAVSAWAGADEAPTDYRVHRPLAAFLQVEEGWLIRGEGEPPRPELWKAWTVARQSDVGGPIPGVRDVPAGAVERVTPVKKPAPRKRANDR